MKTMRPDEIVELASNISLKLQELGIDVNRKYAGMGADFADLYEASCKYQKVLNELLDTPTWDKKSIAKKLVTIQIELYQHFLWHLKELKRPLNKLIKALDEK